ncbi:MAG: TonB-dependent receptor, partial [Sphingomonadales bacterium]|nr:TonB-dependent receptor [Sphingomonadales bacterium]
MTDRFNVRRRGAGATTSWMALGLVLAIGATPAAAQSTAPSAPGTAVEDDSPQEVLVVGSRASQQSANQRKKDARTATDSIVADDIGSFPDRNVNEAISRVPGVALSRNEFGEGDGVAIRGNGPDLTRVELDGIGVQGTTNLAITGASSRGADLRELPADLIKSVDIVKGSTADMTEGGLGGTVQIKTRTGLDFAKPYFSLRAGAQANSLGKKWTPDFNGVATRKFFDDRVGVIVSGNYQKIQNNGHNYENTTSGNRGYARLFDFDQSPEKTFTYNPATVGTDAADVPFANSTGPDGRPLTPRRLVELAAGAQSKAECLTLFPTLPNATANQNAAANAPRTQRILEQQTCLNQWNDYTPSLIRNFVNTQTDQRYSIDGRVDFKATSNLTLFAKGTIANRLVHDQFRSRSPLTMFNQNVAGTFVDTQNGASVIRTVSPNAPAGYYLFDPQYGLSSVTGTANAPGFSSVRPAFGQVLNVVPGSVVVDSKHNVTAMTLTNNAVTIDQIENRIDSRTKYAQAGAEWRSRRLDVDLWGGYTRAEARRGDQRTNRSYTYGTANIALQPNGLWDIQLPAGYDETNPSNFVQLRPAACISGGTNPATCIGQNAVAAGPNGPATPAYLASQLPLTTPSFNVQYSPRLGISSETSAKGDVTYRTDGLIPFISRVKVGGQYRKNVIQRWDAGGYTAVSAVGVFGQPGYVPAVIVPTAQVRGSFRACEPTPGSSAPGGLSCNYGFVPSTNPLNVRSGVDTLTPAELRALFERTLEPADSRFFGDLPNRGNLPPAWQGIRTDELFAALGASQFINDDCLVTCVGSD